MSGVIPVPNADEASFPKEFGLLSAVAASKGRDWEKYKDVLAKPDARKAFTTWAEAHPVIVRNNECLANLDREARKIDMAARVTLPVLSQTAAFLRGIVYQAGSIAVGAIDWANRTNEQVLQTELELFANNVISAQGLLQNLKDKNVSMFKEVNGVTRYADGTVHMFKEVDGVTRYADGTVQLLQELPKEKIYELLQAEPRFLENAGCATSALPLLEKLDAGQLVSLFSREPRKYASPATESSVLEAVIGSLGKKLEFEEMRGILLYRSEKGYARYSPICNLPVFKAAFPWMLALEPEKLRALFAQKFDNDEPLLRNQEICHFLGGVDDDPSAEDDFIVDDDFTVTGAPSSAPLGRVKELREKLGYDFICEQFAVQGVDKSTPLFGLLGKGWSSEPMPQAKLDFLRELVASQGAKKVIDLFKIQDGHEETPLGCLSPPYYQQVLDILGPESESLLDLPVSSSGVTARQLLKYLKD